MQFEVDNSLMPEDNSTTKLVIEGYDNGCLSLLNELEKSTHAIKKATSVTFKIN